MIFYRHQYICAGIAKPVYCGPGMCDLFATGHELEDKYWEFHCKQNEQFQNIPDLAKGKLWEAIIYMCINFLFF